MQIEVEKPRGRQHGFFLKLLQQLSAQEEATTNFTRQQRSTNPRALFSNIVYEQQWETCNENITYPTTKKISAFSGQTYLKLLILSHGYRTSFGTCLDIPKSHTVHSEMVTSV